MKRLFEKYIWRRVGKKIQRIRRGRREWRNFQKWVKLDCEVKLKNRAALRRECENLPFKPLISVLMPVYNVEEEWLRLAIESVLGQIYKNWELCIADDCSPAPHIRRILEEYAARDFRIKTVFRHENGHISAASNSALELASGEYAALLDHDDELCEDALFYVAEEINRFPAADLIYSDEDMFDENGARFNPKFKPDWSQDLFYSVNLVTHLVVYRTNILRKIGGFRTGFEGSQDYDLALRVIEQIPANHIRHIPRILYHWRAIKGSVAFDSDEKPYAHERARAALLSHFERIGKRAVVSQTVYNLHRVQYNLPGILPKVCLIILVDDVQSAKSAVENFVENTDYRNLEIVLVCLESVVAKISNLETPLSKNQSVSIKFMICENLSEAEKYNFAVAQTDGEILCFVDAALKPETKDWLTEMIAFACQTEIGAVGAKLLYADETILHGGLIVGTNNLISIAHQHLPRNESGNYARAQIVNNFSAVSISCLATHREAFDSVGGFNAGNYPNKLFDVDFCLKLGEKKYRIVFTPYAELTKTKTKRRLNLEKNPTAEEKKRFVEKWRETLKRDAFYNPNLSKKDAGFSIDI